MKLDFCTVFVLAFIFFSILGIVRDILKTHNITLGAAMKNLLLYVTLSLVLFGAGVLAHKKCPVIRNLVGECDHKVLPCPCDDGCCKPCDKPAGKTK